MSAIIEHLTIPPFQGTGTNFAYDASKGGLALSGGGQLIDSIGIGEDWDSYGTFDQLLLIDSLPFVIDSNGLIDSFPTIDTIGESGGWDAIESVDAAGGGAVTGEYLFSSGITLNGVYDAVFRRTLAASSFLIDSSIDLKTGLIDTWTDFDGVNSDLATVRVLGRSSNDNVAWSDWKMVTNTVLRGRYFEFKATTETASFNDSTVITELGVTGYLEQRNEVATKSTNGTITFQHPFYDVPGVIVTAFDQQTGDYPAITSATRSSMVVTWKDSSGNPVTRTFTYQATGYGTEIV
jgi:hypothetical protein